MTDKWQPRSARETVEGQRAYQALHEGVPPWLKSSLVDWVIQEHELSYHDERTLRSIERTLRIELDWSSVSRAQQSLVRLAWDDDQFLLDLVDYWLRTKNSEFGPVDRLKGYLEEGGSAWHVAKLDSGGHGLSRRVLPEVQELVEEALESSGSGGKYLRLAWEAAYGRNPEPNKAFDFSVKAMESALIPIVIPKDDKATLGKVISAIRDDPGKWEMRLSGKGGELAVSTFADWLDIVWSSHLRHADSDPDAILTHSPEEARDAVVIAAQVVALVRDGGFKLKAPESANVAAAAK